jgi:hypothetical protein
VYGGIGSAKIENNQIVFDTDADFSGTLEFDENSILLTVTQSDITPAVGTTLHYTIKIERIQKKIKHYFRYEDSAVQFFKDGTAQDVNLYTQLPLSAQYTYKEYPTYLLVGADEVRWDIFDDFGRIAFDWNWAVINYHHVFSNLQITNFESETGTILASDIQEIKETCLIFIIPDEEVDEEWIWYADDRKKEYEAMGIQSVDVKKRYLSFTLYDGEKFIIDTTKDQNGTSYSALLYRRGYIPVMISISGNSEEDMEMIEEYLTSESGDGLPPFEHWNILNE